LSVNRLRTLAGRVVAGQALMEGGNFNTIFQLLFDHHGFSQEHAFNITSRIMQGGGFLKDIIYLKGLIELRAYLMNGGDFELLFAGKFGFNHIHRSEEHTSELQSRENLVCRLLLEKKKRFSYIVLRISTLMS